MSFKELDERHDRITREKKKQRMDSNLADLEKFKVLYLKTHAEYTDEGTFVITTPCAYQCGGLSALVKEYLISQDWIEGKLDINNPGGYVRVAFTVKGVWAHGDD